MLIAATLLLSLTGGLLLVFSLTSRGTGPEGPVGAHMITGPLALGVAAALALGLWAGAPNDWPRLSRIGWFLLPGLVVALTALPIVGLSPTHRLPCLVAVVAGVVGTALVLHGNAPLQLAGGIGATATAAVGYAMVLALVVQNERNRMQVAAADASARSEFEVRQAAWQRDEYAKLPADAGLWQLIQFTHTFAPEVDTACRARIAALPELDAKTIELLGTGWAEHALRWIAECYPHSKAELAPALGTLLDKECDKWRESLRGTEPGSWYGNLVKFLAVAERCSMDGGDLRASLAKWAAMLQGQRGLESLRDRARALAKG